MQSNRLSYLQHGAHPRSSQSKGGRNVKPVGYSLFATRLSSCFCSLLYVYVLFLVSLPVSGGPPFPQHFVNIFLCILLLHDVLTFTGICSCLHKFPAYPCHDFLCSPLSQSLQTYFAFPHYLLSVLILPGVALNQLLSGA